MSLFVQSQIVIVPEEGMHGKCCLPVLTFKVVSVVLHDILKFRTLFFQEISLFVGDILTTSQIVPIMLLGRVKV